MGDIYKAIADPARRMILDGLTQRENQTLFEICTRLTESRPMSRQAVSQHIAVLQDAGLVTVRKEGRSNLHNINPAPLAEIVTRWKAPKTPPTDNAPDTPSDI
ncbi:MAG TPA: metalloregulator ArsR/SmtB family transcription factor [Candidatus Corynebacterium avicola]|uniref:Metalloregulator ArsR/SmtB family transcription factor n=1 Tax=Candidatus Corynebacterium avicola TaxID=2838527 RepID=A0A9D1RQ29_9CORY|nr:metalloregulator ArsR/SmtB family transcription factor [Candidatus Corynebacterium avicola]